MKIESDPTNEERTIFTVEEFLPLLEERGLNYSILRTESVESFLNDSISLALQLLIGLNILHEQFGFVHGDISPSNVMFSPTYKLWKLINFDLSMPIEESEKTIRISGTENFISPETLKTSIFTKESDVYALGMVLCRTIYFAGMCEFIEYMDLEPKPIEIIDKFSTIIAKMTDRDPQKRLKTSEAIKSLFDLLKNVNVKIGKMKI